MPRKKKPAPIDTRTKAQIIYDTAYTYFFKDLIVTEQQAEDLALIVTKIVQSPKLGLPNALAVVFSVASIFTPMRRKEPAKPYVAPTLTEEMKALGEALRNAV